LGIYHKNNVGVIVNDEINKRKTSVFNGSVIVYVRLAECVKYFSHARMLRLTQIV